MNRLADMPDDQFWGCIMLLALFGPWLVPVVAPWIVRLIDAWTGAGRRGGAA